MVCKVTFCSKFPDIPDKTGRKREVEEHRQLQSVMHFTRMQKTNFKVISVVAKRIATNYIVYIDSCIPKHIIYQHSHKKGNLLIAILKKKKNIDIRPLTGKTNIVRNGIYINFKNSRELMVESVSITSTQNKIAND